jgi:magnesium transporter
VAHRTNGVMKVLTIVSTVLLPASLIVAIFGTSFEGIPLYQPFGFFAMLAAIIVVTVSALLFFRHRKWI